MHSFNGQSFVGESEKLPRALLLLTRHALPVLFYVFEFVADAQYLVRKIARLVEITQDCVTDEYLSKVSLGIFVID